MRGFFCRERSTSCCPRTSLADDANRGAAIGGRVLIWIAHLLTLLTLLGFGGRWHWYLETMGHFRVQYLVLLLVCGTLFWLAARWRRALVTTGVAAVNLAVVLPFLFRCADGEQYGCFDDRGSGKRQIFQPPARPIITLRSTGRSGLVGVNGDHPIVGQDVAAARRELSVLR